MFYTRSFRKDYFVEINIQLSQNERVISSIDGQIPRLSLTRLFLKAIGLLLVHLEQTESVSNRWTLSYLFMRIHMAQAWYKNHTRLINCVAIKGVVTSVRVPENNCYLMQLPVLTMGIPRLIMKKMPPYSFSDKHLYLAGYLALMATCILVLIRFF